MSLDSDLTKIKDYKELWLPVDDSPTRQFKLNPLTEAIIWTTMFVKLGTITEKNLDEWAFRLKILDQIGTRSISEKVADEDGKERWEERVPTMAEIERHIGLSVNVADMTRTQFLNDIRRILKEEGERAVFKYHESKKEVVKC